MEERGSLRVKENCSSYTRAKLEVLSSLLCTNFQGRESSPLRARGPDLGKSPEQKRLAWRLEGLVVGLAAASSSSLIRCKTLLNELQRRFQSDERHERGPIPLSREEEDDLRLMGLMGFKRAARPLPEPLGYHAPHSLCTAAPFAESRPPPPRHTTLVAAVVSSA